MEENRSIPVEKKIAIQNFVAENSTNPSRVLAYWDSQEAKERFGGHTLTFVMMAEKWFSSNAVVKRATSRNAETLASMQPLYQIPDNRFLERYIKTINSRYGPSGD